VNMRYIFQHDNLYNSHSMMIQKLKHSQYFFFKFPKDRSYWVKIIFISEFLSITCLLSSFLTFQVL